MSHHRTRHLVVRAAAASFTILFVAASCAAPSRSSTQADHRVAGVATITPWTAIGESRGGRPVDALTIGDGGRRIAVLAGIHGDEREGGRHLEAVLDTLMAASGGALIRVIADVNPDGTAANRRTTNVGVDPNRNWPSSNFQPHAKHGPAPLSEPAVEAVHRDLVAFDPELVIVFHSTSRGPFVNFDGPGEAHARLFAGGAGAPWKVVPTMGYPTPGSLGSWMGVDRKTPILTIEFDRGSSPEDSGPALLAGLRSVLTGVAPETGSLRNTRDAFRVR